MPRCVLGLWNAVEAWQSNNFQCVGTIVNVCVCGACVFMRMFVMCFVQLRPRICPHFSALNRAYTGMMCWQ